MSEAPLYGQAPLFVSFFFAVKDLSTTYPEVSIRTLSGFGFQFGFLIFGVRVSGFGFRV